MQSAVASVAVVLAMCAVIGYGGESVVEVKDLAVDDPRLPELVGETLWQNTLGEIDLVETAGEDYTTLETIRTTGGVVRTVTPGISATGAFSRTRTAS